jgi:hypothetical protein
MRNKMQIYKIAVAVITTCLILFVDNSATTVERNACKESAIKLVTENAHLSYLKIRNSKKKYVEGGPILSFDDFKREYIVATGEIPSIFHFIELYEVHETYNISGSDIVCCSVDSTFIIDLIGENSGGDSLMLSKTLSLLNYLVTTEAPREYTNNELISILELGLKLQAHLFDRSGRMYPRILSMEGTAWQEFEAHVLSQEQLADSVTLRKKQNFIDAIFDDGLEEWISFGDSRINPPFTTTTLNGVEITIHTLSSMSSVQRNVFLWSDGQFTLKSQKLLKKSRD